MDNFPYVVWQQLCSSQSQQQTECGSAGEPERRRLTGRKEEEEQRRLAGRESSSDRLICVSDYMLGGPGDSLGNMCSSPAPVRPSVTTHR